MTVAKDAEIGSEKTIYLNILVFYSVGVLLLFIFGICSHFATEN